MHKILILTSGPVDKLAGFEAASKVTGVEADLGSFYDINFHSKSGKVRWKGNDIANYALIYFRLVGKSLETAALVAEYAKDNGVKVVDKVYEVPNVLASTVSKYLEHYKLAKAVPIPATYFASIDTIRENGHEIFGYPFVVKSTTGRKSRDVWLVESGDELIFNQLRERELAGDRFFAQTYIASKTRIRVLVIGGNVVAGFERSSKYLGKILGSDVTVEQKEAMAVDYTDVPTEYAKLAVKAAKSTDLEICGVDLLKDDQTGELYVIEANAAPAWNLINKHSGVIVEERILKYLSKKLESPARNPDK